jgi:hypothetical protein
MTCSSLHPAVHYFDSLAAVEGCSSPPFVSPMGKLNFGMTRTVLANDAKFWTKLSQPQILQHCGQQGVLIDTGHWIRYRAKREWITFRSPSGSKDYSRRWSVASILTLVSFSIEVYSDYDEALVADDALVTALTSADTVSCPCTSWNGGWKSAMGTLALRESDQYTSLIW